MDNKVDWALSIINHRGKKKEKKEKENKKKGGFEFPLGRRLDLLVGDNWRFTVLSF